MSVGTYALTSLADLKEFLGIPLESAGNEMLLESCVDRATGLFEHVTNRKLMARDYSYDSGSGDYDSDNAVINGNGRNRMILPQYPVNAVTTLRINETGISQSTSIYACGWVIEDKAAGIMTLRCYVYTEGLKNIDWAYNAGFAAAPDDLEEAAIEQAAWYFKQAGPGGNLLGVASKTLADGSISYNAKDLLPAVKMTLERYKKRIAY